MKKIKTDTIWLSIAFIVMAILFYSSSQTYAQQSQVGLLHHLLADKPLQQFFAQHPIRYGGAITDAKVDYFKYVEFYLRKFAHFATYFTLGLSWWMGLKGRIKNVWLTAFVAWQAATGYAALDEIHQQLTGGRSPMFADVLLDSIGAATAIAIGLVVVIATAVWRKRKNG